MEIIQVDHFQFSFFYLFSCGGFIQKADSLIVSDERFDSLYIADFNHPLKGGDG